VPPTPRVAQAPQENLNLREGLLFEQIEALPLREGSCPARLAVRLRRPQKEEGRLARTLDRPPQHRLPQRRHQLQPLHRRPQGRQHRARPPYPQRYRDSRRGGVWRPGHTSPGRVEGQGRRSEEGLIPARARRARLPVSILPETGLTRGAVLLFLQKATKKTKRGATEWSPNFHPNDPN